MAKLRTTIFQTKTNTFPMTNIQIFNSWPRFVALRCYRFVNADQSNVAYSPRITDANELNGDTTKSKVNKTREIKKES